MSQATSNKIWVTSGHYNYCWIIVDYSMSGQTMTYTVTLHFDGGCAQFRNIYLKVGGTTLKSGGAHAYNSSHQSSAHNAVIWSNQTTTITGTQTVTFGGEKYVDGTNWESTTGSFSVTGGVAPAAPTVTLDSFTDTTATLSIAVSDYGTPAAASGRKLRGAVLGLNSWTDPCRYQDVTDVSSATVTLSNTSGTGATPLTIAGNTEYYYGANANNTALSTTTIANSTFVTLPAYITGITAVDDGNHNMNISVLHANEGSAQTVYTEYSYDQTNWNLVQDQFHLTVNTPTTIYFRRSNNSGYTPVYSTVVSPTRPVKLYGSVNGTTHQVERLYGSVNGTTHKIKRLYGSVNGVTQLVYEDNS